MAEGSDGGSAFIRCIREVRGAVFAQRSTILISVFAAWALSYPAVTREVYRVLADDAYDLLKPSARQLAPHGVTWVPISLTFVTLFLAAAAIWYVGRDLVGQTRPDESQAGSVNSIVQRGLAAFFALLLPAAAALGLFWASLDAEALGALPYEIGPRHHADYPSPMTFTQERMKLLLGSMAAVAWLLRLGAYVCLGMAAVLLALILWMEFSGKAGRFGAFLRYALLLAAAGIVALFSLSVTMPELSAIPRWVGTIGLFNFFIVALALFVGLGVLISDRFGVPILALLVVFAIAIAFLDLNDNHVVPQMNAKNKGEWKSVSSEFPQWLQSRADLAAYQDEPYPVFIVSAAGGGLYAAQHAARFLARMQDHCPHFAQHIFAISGVSGGSVGAAVFASLVNAKVEKQESTPRCTGFGDKQGPLERDARAILGRDFLSPIVAATLFPDFLQRFVPTPIAQFDRGQVFDKALEAAWKKRLPGLGNPLAMPMTDLWDPKGHTPALVLNATHVSTGSRFAMAPFQPYLRTQKAIKLEWLQAHLQSSAYDATSGQADIKLSSAAGISARFPWVMPAATVVTLKQSKDRKNTTLRLVDGGYFENSGADTAGDIIRFLDGLKGSTARPFKVYMLVLTSHDNALFGGDFNDETPFAEITAPLRGLLSTRQARGDLSIVRTLDHLCPDLDNCNSEKDDRGWHNKAKWIFATLNLRDSKLPLSWHLSEASHRFVGLHAGAPSDCGNAFHGVIPIWTVLPPDEPEDPPHPARVMAALNTANCAASIVCGQLANKKIAFSPTTGKMENYCNAWDTAGPALAPGVVPTSGK